MHASIRTRLILLVLIATVPLIVSTLLVTQRLASEQAETQRRTIVATTRALAAAVDAELQKYAAVAYSLRTSLASQNGDYATFHETATKAVSRLPGSWVVVADPSGQQLVNTLRPPGTPLPLIYPLDIHLRALQTGKDQVGDIADGPVAQKPAVGIFVPVVEEDRPRVDIVVGLDAQVFARLLQGQGFAPGWVAGIADRKFNFVARSVENDRYMKRPISAGWMKAAQTGGEPTFTTISQEGLQLQSAFTKLPNSEWTVSVGASEETLDAPRKQSLVLIGSISTALLIAGTGLAWFAARPIIISMRSLQDASAALIHDRATPLRPTNLTEVDQALVAFDIASSKIREREASHQILIGELNHRVKNTLAVVQSVALSARKTATSVESFTEGFVSRVLCLARTHDLLTDKNWGEIDLKEIVTNELAAFQNQDQSRALISGASVLLPSHEAISVSMIMHELATNAAKYGALSTTSGRLTVDWTMSADLVSLTWVEIDGPTVRVPSHKSFGTRLIYSLASDLGGKAQLQFLGPGVQFSMTFAVPIANRTNHFQLNS